MTSKMKYVVPNVERKEKILQKLVEDVETLQKLQKSTTLEDL